MDCTGDIGIQGTSLVNVEILVEEATGIMVSTGDAGEES
jgi:hypothetical protein